MEPPQINGRMSPVEFVTKWLPIYTKYTWGQHGSRKAAIEMLIQLTDYKFNSINNWLSNDSEVPGLVFRYLFVVDVMWEISRKINSTE